MRLGKGSPNRCTWTASSCSNNPATTNCRGVPHISCVWGSTRMQNNPDERNAIGARRDILAACNMQSQIMLPQRLVHTACLRHEYQECMQSMLRPRRSTLLIDHNTSHAGASIFLPFSPWQASSTLTKTMLLTTSSTSQSYT